MRAVHVYSDGLGYITIDWNWKNINVYTMLNHTLNIIVWKPPFWMEFTSELFLEQTVSANLYEGISMLHNLSEINSYFDWIDNGWFWQVIFSRCKTTLFTRKMLCAILIKRNCDGITFGYFPVVQPSINILVTWYRQLHPHSPIQTTDFIILL